MVAQSDWRSGSARHQSAPLTRFPGPLNPFLSDIMRQEMVQMDTL